MREDLRTELMVSVAEVAWNLIEDGIAEDTAINDAMGDVYSISLRALPGWDVKVVGLCPATLLPREQRWQFELEVYEFIKGEWDEMANVGSQN